MEVLIIFSLNKQIMYYLTFFVMRTVKISLSSYQEYKKQTRITVLYNISLELTFLILARELNII